MKSAQKLFWKISVLIFITSFCFGFISCNSVDTVDIVGKGITEYLQAEDEFFQYNYIYANYRSDLGHQSLGLSWNDGEVIGRNENYTVFISDHSDYSNAYTMETREKFSNYGITVPGKKYYWKVTGPDGRVINEGKFKVKENVVRFVDIGNVKNVRDLGGWATQSGNRVKYELLYRGAMLNGSDPISEYGAYIMKDLLGIKTEIDLRGSWDDGGQTACAFGESLNYVKAPITQYAYIIPEFEQSTPIKRNYDEGTKDSIRKIFDCISVVDNYPIYFHCAYGADRTGTLAFLINGLLGVSYEDLIKDFELTSFGLQQIRLRGTFDSDTGKFVNGVFEDSESNYVAFGKMKDMMMEYYGTSGGTLSDAIENYLVNRCGVPIAQIENTRKILLG